jgi:hypothetical protein
METKSQIYRDLVVWQKGVELVKLSLSWQLNVDFSASETTASAVKLIEDLRPMLNGLRRKLRKIA